MTKKLYDLDSHRRDFSATVLRCDADGERYAVVLDQTLFFPEGGGQPARSRATPVRLPSALRAAWRCTLH